MNHLNELQNKLSQPEETLLLEIGKELGLTSMKMGEPDDDELLEDAEQWVSQRMSALRIRICESHVGSLIRIREHKWNDVLLVAAIADLITGLTTGVSPVTVAALLVRRGVSALCDDDK